jgi:very-short-patch-repair endonuclease
MSYDEVFELAGRQYGLAGRWQVVVDDASRAWVKNALRMGRIQVVLRGVYGVRGYPASWERDVMARVLAAGPGAGASHYTAAAHRHVNGFYRSGLIHVSRPWKRSRESQKPGLHESLYLPDHHLTIVRGIATTTAERTMFDLAPRLHEDRLLRVFNDIITADMATIGSMEKMFAETAKRGRWGSAVMRQLLSTKGEGYIPTESELEDLVEEVLGGAGIVLPRRQVSVGGTTAPIGRMDFLFERARPPLVLEADSRSFHKLWSVIEADQRRTLLLTAAGFDILRVTWRQLTQEPELFIAAVRAKLARAA